MATSSESLPRSARLAAPHNTAKRRERLFGVTDLFLVVLAIYDWRTRDRIHPATLWGGLFLIASQPLRLAIGFTSAWQSFAGWLLS